MVAGLATLRELGDRAIYDRVARYTTRLLDGLREAAAKAGVAFSTTQVGSMFGLFFSAAAPRSFAEATRCDIAAFKPFFHAMLDRGVYLAPSAYEAGFVSAAHGEPELAITLDAARAAFTASRS
jgi:glutamate-1-semialdehyde 2,1-aminomutase